MKRWLKVVIAVYLIVAIFVFLDTYTDIFQFRFLIDAPYLVPIVLLPLVLFLWASPMIIIAIVVFRVMERRRGNRP